jgi:hypothetical protein
VSLFEGFKLGVVNRLPSTKWPLRASVYRLYGKNQIKFDGSDDLRPYTDADGNYLYIFKGTGEKILPPQGGLEDVGDSVTLIQVADGDYRFATVSLDETSKNLVLSLADDEQVKFLYAKVCEDTAKRFQPETPWYKSAIFALVVTAILITGMVLIGTSGVSAQIGALENRLGTLVTSLNINNELLNQTIGAFAGGRPPA